MARFGFSFGFIKGDDARPKNIQAEQNTLARIWGTPRVHKTHDPGFEGLTDRVNLLLKGCTIKHSRARGEFHETEF